MVESPIDLRITLEPTPDPEPERTLYRDLAGLPSTTYLSLTIRFYNNSGQLLYFEISGSHQSYSFSSVQLGSLSDGADRYYNLHKIASRTKPSNPITETVTLTLSAYTDAAYTNLFATKTRNLQIVWIDSEEGNWSISEDTFETDNEGWQAEAIAGYTDEIARQTDYVLDGAYSWGYRQYSSSSQQGSFAKMYKTYSVPNKTEVYLILNIRNWKSSSAVYPKNFEISVAGSKKIFIGRPYDSTTSAYHEENTWMKIILPLADFRDQDVTVQITTRHYRDVGSGVQYWRIDSIKLISR